MIGPLGKVGSLAKSEAEEAKMLKQSTCERRHGYRIDTLTG